MGFPAPVATQLWNDGRRRNYPTLHEFLFSHIDGLDTGDLQPGDDCHSFLLRNAFLTSHYGDVHNMLHDHQALGIEALFEAAKCLLQERVSELYGLSQHGLQVGGTARSEHRVVPVISMGPWNGLEMVSPVGIMAEPFDPTGRNECQDAFDAVCAGTSNWAELVDLISWDADLMFEEE